MQTCIKKFGWLPYHRTTTRKDITSPIRAGISSNETIRSWTNFRLGGWITNLIKHNGQVDCWCQVGWTTRKWLKMRLPTKTKCCKPKILLIWAMQVCTKFFIIWEGGRFSVGCSRSCSYATFCGQSLYMSMAVAVGDNISTATSDETEESCPRHMCCLGIRIHCDHTRANLSIERFIGCRNSDFCLEASARHSIAKCGRGCICLCVCARACVCRRLPGGAPHLNFIACQLLSCSS